MSSKPTDADLQKYLDERSAMLAELRKKEPAFTTRRAVENRVPDRILLETLVPQTEGGKESRVIVSDIRLPWASVWRLCLQVAVFAFLAGIIVGAIMAAARCL